MPAVIRVNLAVEADLLAFNSLFEMLEFEQETEPEPKKKAFNSLFEMRHTAEALRLYAV